MTELPDKSNVERRAVKLSNEEHQVLEAYRRECDADPDGAFAPIYPGISSALEGDVDLVLTVCRNLKRRGLLDGTIERGRAAVLGSSLWISDKGAEALESVKST